MKDYELGKFTKLFLKRQDLTDFSLVFKPFNVRAKARRSKRENTWIQAEDPSLPKKLPKTRTVNDLIELFHKLAPETRNWIVGPRSYRAKLTDGQGDDVNSTETLLIARQRPENRRESNCNHVSNEIKKVLDYADTLLDSGEISTIVKAAIRDRYGK